MDPTYINLLLKKIEIGQSLKSFKLPPASLPQIAEAILEVAEARNSEKEAPLRAEIMKLAAKGKLNYSQFQSSALKTQALFFQAEIDPDEALVNLHLAGDSETEFQVLLRIAEKGSWDLIEYLKSNPLNDPEKLKAILLKLASTDPMGLLNALPELNFSDSNLRFELFKILVQKYPIDFASSPENFEALSMEEKCRLFWLGFRIRSSIIDTPFGGEVYLANRQNDHFIAASHLFFKDYTKAEALIGSLPQIDTSIPFVYKQKLILEMLFLSATQETEALEWLRSSKVLLSFFEKRAHETLAPIYFDFFAQVTDPSFRDRLDASLRGRSDKFAPLALILGLFQMNGVRPPESGKVYLVELKDKTQLQIVLKALISLFKTYALSVEEKQNVLHTLFEKNPVARAQALESIFSFGEASRLKEKLAPEVLLNLLFKSLLESLGISSQDFSTLTLYPKGLPYFPVYASRLATLDDNNVALKNFAYFMQALIDQKKKKKRNDPKLNPNLGALTSTQLSLWTQKHSPKPLTKNGYSLQNTDDPMDLFLSGTYAKSCLKLDGNPEYSKGLLGYLLNGGVRLLVIKNAEGKIKARTVVRILYDQKQKPVLVQEDAYTSTGYEPLEKLLQDAALNLAKQMDMPLLRETGDEPYPEDIISYGSLGAYEYSDLYYTQMGEVSKNGKFRLKNLFKVQIEPDKTS